MEIKETLEKIKNFLNDNLTKGKMVEINLIIQDIDVANSKKVFAMEVYNQNEAN